MTAALALALATASASAEASASASASAAAAAAKSARLLRRRRRLVRAVARAWRLGDDPARPSGAPAVACALAALGAAAVADVAAAYDRRRWREHCLNPFAVPFATYGGTFATYVCDARTGECALLPDEPHPALLSPPGGPEARARADALVARCAGCATLPACCVEERGLWFVAVRLGVAPPTTRIGAPGGAPSSENRGYDWGVVYCARAAIALVEWGAREGVSPLGVAPPPQGLLRSPTRIGAPGGAPSSESCCNTGGSSGGSWTGAVAAERGGGYE